MGGLRLVIIASEQAPLPAQRILDDSLAYQMLPLSMQLIGRFGFDPGEVDSFVGEYGWTVLEQVGVEALRARYMVPAGRSGPISEIERLVYAEKRTPSPDSGRNPQQFLPLVT